MVTAGGNGTLLRNYRPMLAPLPPVFTPPPILMYHRVDVDHPADPVGRDLTVTPQQFEQQLRIMRLHGLRAVSMAEMERRLRAGERVDRIVVLTFDDGYADQYRYAVPLLRKYDGSATFYIVTGQVGRPRHLTWQQIRSLQAQGMEIGAHGVEHDDLSAMSAAQQTYQIRTSVDRLRSFAHAPVTSYAYPSGRFNSATLGIVEKAGIETAVTTDAAYVLRPESRFEISRVRVRSEWDAPAFWNVLQAAEGTPHPVRS